MIRLGLGLGLGLSKSLGSLPGLVGSDGIQFSITVVACQDENINNVTIQFSRELLH